MAVLQRVFAIARAAMHAEIVVVTAQYACNSMHVRNRLGVSHAILAPLREKFCVADGKHSKHEQLQWLIGYTSPASSNFLYQQWCLPFLKCDILHTVVWLSTIWASWTTES